VLCVHYILSPKTNGGGTFFCGCDLTIDGFAGEQGDRMSL
jgi:hypothetical protein